MTPNAVGVVMSFTPGKFGFIRTAPDQNRGIFFPHDQADIDLAPGDRVTFVLHHDREGRPLARHVRKVER
jgi:cold shock CspA family protein